MSWRDNLKRASFRGVPFEVLASDADMGRRVQVHEYPLRDKPYAEDLGRRSRSVSLDAYVLGADYMVARDRLLAAVEQAGHGELQHPYLGAMRASCVSCRLRETTAEGGMARFALEFVESGEFTFPSAVADTGAAVDGAAESASTVVRAGFEAGYAVAGRAQFVADAAASIVSQALAEMQGAVRWVRTQSDQVAALNRSIVTATRQLITLIYTPASAAQALAGNLRELVRNVSTDIRDALGLARVFYDFGSLLPPVTGSTGSRQAQAANQAQLLRLMRVMAVAEGARAASLVQYASYQDAVATRDELLAAMDALMIEPGLADDVYQALRTLRAALVRDLAARGANLARLVSWTPSTTMPALVVAHHLYGDATRADEIVARNRARHPLFLAGGQALEVLNDAI